MHNNMAPKDILLTRNLGIFVALLFYDSKHNCITEELFFRTRPETDGGGGRQ